MKPLPAGPRPRHRPARTRTARTRTGLRALAGVPGCLALACGLLLGSAASSAAKAPHAHTVPVPPVPPVPAVPAEPGSGGTAVLAGSVTPFATEVAADRNGDFVLTVVNAGSTTAGDVRVLLDDEGNGNGVGSADGRCLSRQDASSPADLWCELGDLAPRQSAAVQVHAFMSRCVGPLPLFPLVREDAAAFRWQVGHTDGGRATTVNGPTPRWSCPNSRRLADLDTDPAARRP
ncbi:hypothetical protein [Actinacidiphila sp. ITFR-21]|uniref:hypothetical protein n=1 Tax=Actinacidiphila sp. ITFR-21 TaxID=3075199 RepID=UPI00288BAD5D|nr:hypothetical protein [Streptomyces sp. ITFR-21]WNI18550.1 hypothetical protein RLT57_25475 [Streptomyces sp. ITFR-21]